ncbi:tautomerase family protein [Aidingimonas halophila]|uniref:tautomerase family protein n=1 Tax=Aidingimonas halophila TaxID=574349 RepID=UPI001E5D5A37|nr:tautomerase family protein [Aidingimonas halophila]
MDAEDFYYPGGRTPAYTVIEINMIQGRAPETQKALIKELFSKIESVVGISSVDTGRLSTFPAWRPSTGRP